LTGAVGLALRTSDMLGEEWLLHGLNAMSRAHEADYFKDGHVGAAVIASYYLCRDADVEDGVAPLLAARMADRWLPKPLFAPVPEEARAPKLVTGIVDVMRDNIVGLRQAGHNVIFPSLALKAFRDRPDAVTRYRADGIRRLIERFQVTDVPLDEDRDLPQLGDSHVFAESALSEFVGCTQRFIGRGQGWSGHLLTYAAALLDLGDLGYHDLVHDAEDGFLKYIRRIRLGPLDQDVPRAEPPLMKVVPTQRAYWEQTVGGDWEFGHVIKYPYGFCRLMKLARDRELKEKCRAVAFRIF